MAAVAPYHRAGRAVRLRDRGGHQCAAAALSAAQTPALLARSRRLPAGTLRPGPRGRAATLCLYAVCGRAAALHRGDLRSVRNAHAPVQGRPALPPGARPRHAAGAGSADQSTHQIPPAHEAGTPLMQKATTLTELLESNRNVARSVTYLEGENESRSVSFAELHERALGILYHLQRIGARRGDRLILFIGHNEQFIDAFWAALLGGIVPVPIAIGISDEHRHKFLRIARKLGTPFVYTDRKSIDRIGAFAAQAGENELFLS